MGETYIFVGSAYGRFETDNGALQEFANMFVVSPVSTYESDNYHAAGYKAEKLKCASSEVFAGLNPGDRVNLFFDSKKRVSFVTSAD